MTDFSSSKLTDLGGVKLTPEDYEFMNVLNEEITEFGSLPFTLPAVALPRIIVTSAKWFYRECEDAQIERWFMVSHSDIIAARDSEQNAELRLPEQIEAVLEIHPVTSSMGLTFGRVMNFFREPMFYAATMNTMGGINAISNNALRAADRDKAWDESVARLYEFNQFKTLFTKGIRFDYNPNSHVINFLGKVDGDIVMSTLQRIPLSDLYKDDRFLKHCASSALEKLKRILKTFNFTYPGEVTLDFEDLESMGRERRKEIEEEIRKSSDPSDLFIIR